MLKPNIVMSRPKKIVGAYTLMFEVTTTLLCCNKRTVLNKTTEETKSC